MSSPEELLKKGLRALSLHPTPTQLSAFMVYLRELKKWNKAYNLTSLKRDEEIVIKHFLDSLLYLGPLPEGEITLIDVGSGAGFPGIPLKIMRPEIDLCLVEPSRKKAAFVRHVAKALGLDAVAVIEKRVEDLDSFGVDVVVTRALFDLEEFVRKGMRLLKAGGILIVSKGPKVKDELKEIKGLDYEVKTAPLPLVDIKRHLVVVRRTEKSGKERVKGPTSVRRPESILISPNICVNADCRLRSAGCRGFEGCPGFKARSL